MFGLDMNLWNSRPDYSKKFVRRWAFTGMVAFAALIVDWVKYHPEFWTNFFNEEYTFTVGLGIAFVLAIPAWVVTILQQEFSKMRDK